MPPATRGAYALLASVCDIVRSTPTLHSSDPRYAQSPDHREIAAQMKAVLTSRAWRQRIVCNSTRTFPIRRLRRDEVLVRIAATAVNYHDIFTRRGMPGISIPLPVIVGSDIAGEVVAVGADVHAWKPGDRVLIDPVFRDGERTGMIGETTHGGRAELIAVPAAQLIAVPPGVSLEDAASLPLAYGTAYRMLVTQGRLARGEKILILGASGGVGVACVQIAKLLGAEVLAVTSSPAKMRALSTLGADHAIDSSQGSCGRCRQAHLRQAADTGGGGVDVAVNFTGGDTLARHPAHRDARRSHSHLRSDRRLRSGDRRALPVDLRASLHRLERLVRGGSGGAARTGSATAG